jgi:tetratricopeptide (TPR) repeat protein
MAYAEALIMTHDIAEAGRQARCAVSLKHEEDPNWLARAASTIVRSDLDLAIAEQYIQQAHIRAEASELEFGLLYVAHNVDGFIAFQRGEFAKAEERFAKADDSEPGFSEYPFLVAQLFIDHGLAEEARDMLIQESAKYSSPEFGKVRSRFRRSIEGLPRAATNRPKRHDGWMKVAELVLSKSPPSHIRCPVNDDGELVIEWLPHGNNERGKCHLLCPTCGAQLNVVITGS